MAWAAVESFRKCLGKRKGLLTGLVGVAVDEAIQLVPGARLCIRIMGEVAKHGVDRLLDKEAEVPEIKPAGQVFPTEQLDQINTWLGTLSISYAGLLDKLEKQVSAREDQTDAELTALVKNALQERADLAREFDACVKEVRQVTLSLSRIEEILDYYFHEVRHVSLCLEEIKTLFVESPLMADWALFRQARPDALQVIVQADEHFLAGRRDQGVALLVELLRKRGAGQATIAHHLGLAYVSQGQLADARRCLTEVGAAARQPSPALTHAVSSMAHASGRNDQLPVWRSLPRGFVVDNRYQLDSEIGRGGMASVYKAVGIDRVNRGQIVALKVPAPELMADDKTSGRFVQEIAVSKLLSASRHPGIVQTLDYVIFDEPHTQKKLYGLVLEYIDGLSLDKFLALRQAKQKPLTAQEIIYVLKPICQALDFAHSQVPPVLHRDLKPHNVMLARRKAVKLMDFGIARVLEEGRDTLTGEGEVVGTSAYMPPEFHHAKGVIDIRSDVYLAGNLLLELLTFHPKGNPEGRPDCPSAWVDLINDSMSQGRGRRPKTMREFLTRLEGKQPELTKMLSNSIGMKLTLIPPGKFLMGSPKTEKGRSANEDPQHMVTISRPFYMGVYAVTQEHYESIMGKNPAHFVAEGGGSDHPVDRVSWADAVEFCQKLSELPEEKRFGRIYRLPTEAEWEYACRAAKQTPFHFGPTLSSAEANFDGREPYGGAQPGPWLQKTTPVGSFPPNPFGLYDMHGNVWEWCADAFDRNYYRMSPDEDPPGPAGGEFRVVRGGSWDQPATKCRAASRLGVRAEDHTNTDFGFRVVCTVSTDRAQRPTTAESGFRFVE